MARRLRRDEYTVGWVCALPIELSAALEMLDEKHRDLPPQENDDNIYTLGRIGVLNVVLAGLPAGQIGLASAAVVSMRMKSSFPAIRFGLMVGNGGGVPSEDADVRLGDVVVSQPERGHGGVIQYDLGKSTPSGFEQTGFLNSPPPVLLSAVTKLRALYDCGKVQLAPHLSKLARLPKFTLENAGPDVLFEAGYDHEGGGDCGRCEVPRQVERRVRVQQIPAIHYGTIASANQVMRDGKTRDKVSAAFKGVLCFEMEAAGLMNSFPCLVIRGICDYADSHKNKAWQPYAAGTAAAYAKELLRIIPVAHVRGMRTADEAIQGGSSPHRAEQSPVHCIPFPRNHRFVGRRAQLDRLRQKLLVDKDCRKVALVGLGGIGKTQVALQFAHLVKENHIELSVFWVLASSMEPFERGYREIAKALKLRPTLNGQEDIKKLVKQYLSGKTAGKWLLFVDNADDIDLLHTDGRAEGLADSIPESEDGLVVFTTRNYDVAQSVAGSDVIEIGGMATSEAVDLLKKSAVQNVSENGALIRLLAELECLPLAITQAAAYVNRNKTPFSEYLSLLKNTEQDAVALLGETFKSDARYDDSQNAVAKTWITSFDQISKHDTIAADLLGFISCIGWKDIPYSMLPVVQPAARTTRAVGTLCSYFFLERLENSKRLNMHRVVHLATRAWVRETGRKADTVREAVKHLSSIFPTDDYANRETWQEYLPHVTSLEKDDEWQNTRERGRLCLKVGRCLLMDGKTTEAISWLQKGYKWTKENHPEDHPARLNLQHNLARAYSQDNKAKMAIELLEALIATEARLLPVDNPDLLASRHELAAAYLNNGQIQKAIEQIEAVVNENAMLAEGHPQRLFSRHELARAYYANGQVDKAVKLLESIVATGAKVFTEDHPHRIVSQQALARVYLDIGQAQRAVKLLEAIDAIHRRLPVDHPRRLHSQHALAEAYTITGRAQTAVGLLEAVVMMRRKVLAEDDARLLSSQHELAAAYIKIGRAAMAANLLETIVAMRRSVLAEDDPHLLASQHQLAGAYVLINQVTTATELLKNVVAVKARVLAKDHPSRQASERLLEYVQRRFLVKETRPLIPSRRDDRPVEPETTAFDDDNSSITTLHSSLSSLLEKRSISISTSQRNPFKGRLGNIVKKLRWQLPDWV